MRWLPFVLATVLAGCAAPSAPENLDRSTHVGRVIEDVTAIMEGMAEAHSERPLVQREPTAPSDGSRARN